MLLQLLWAQELIYDLGHSLGYDNFIYLLSKELHQKVKKSTSLKYFKYFLQKIRVMEASSRRCCSLFFEVGH